MKDIDSSTRYLPFLCIRLGYAPTVTTQCIVCVENGRPIAGVLYDSYNTVSVNAHIWIEEGKLPSKEWYYAIFDYPFNQLHLTKIVGQVKSSNEKARVVDENFGFVLEATVKDFSPEGDLLIYTMTRAQCRILNSPRWSKIGLRLVEAV